MCFGLPSPLTQQKLQTLEDAMNTTKTVTAAFPIMFMRWDLVKFLTACFRATLSFLWLQVNQFGKWKRVWRLEKSTHSKEGGHINVNEDRPDLEHRNQRRRKIDKLLFQQAIDAHVANSSFL